MYNIHMNHRIEKTILVSIHGQWMRIRTDSYSLQFAAGQDAAQLAAGIGVSNKAAGRVFESRRETRLRQLKNQRNGRQRTVNFR